MRLSKRALVLALLLLTGLCLAGMFLLYLAIPAEIATVALWYVTLLKGTMGLLSPPFWLLAFCFTALWLWRMPQLCRQEISAEANFFGR